MAIKMEFQTAEIMHSGIPQALVNAVAAGQSCQIGSTSIYPDEENQKIWLCDPYGVDLCASSTFTIGDVASALKAVNRAIEVDMGDNLHDQMYCPEAYDDAPLAYTQH